MIKSMTGYGRCETEAHNRKVNIEISCVNHRYCELSIRMPKGLTPLEEQMRKKVKTFISRGKVEVNLFMTSVSEDDVEVVVNEGACTAYVEALRQIGNKLGLEDNIGLAELMRLKDVISIHKKASDLEDLWPMIEAALDSALQSVMSMREKEGMALKEDLTLKASRILEVVKMLEQVSDQVVQGYKVKLEDRIHKLLEEIPIDEARLATELALFADRAAIDEELTRMRSHVDQLQAILEEEGSVGRKLDFLMQEMNREANTIASKASEYQITSCAVELKTEIEKMREQIQNIE